MDAGELVTLMGKIDKQLTEIRAALGKVEADMGAIRSKKLISMPNGSMSSAILSFWDQSWEKMHGSSYFKPGTRADELKLAKGIWKAAQNHGIGIGEVYKGIEKFQSSSWGCGKDFKVFYSSSSQYILKPKGHKKMKLETENKAAELKQRVFQSDIDYANENAASPTEIKEILDNLPWRKR